MNCVCGGQVLEIGRVAISKGNGIHKLRSYIDRAASGFATQNPLCRPFVCVLFAFRITMRLAALAGVQDTQRCRQTRDGIAP